MPRPKKDNHAMTIRLATHLYERLNEFCEASGQSKTIAIERALEMYINNYDEKQRLLEKMEQGANSAHIQGLEHN